MRSAILKRVGIRFIPYYMTLYICNCLNSNFFTLYLTERGFSSAWVGTIMSFMPIAALLGSFVWSNAADKARYKNLIVFILLAGAAVCSYAITFSIIPAYVILMVGLFSFFFSPIAPLNDTIALESLAKAGEDYGPIRMWGSMSFAVFSAVAGMFFESGYGKVPVAMSIIFVISLCLSFMMPKVEGHRKKAERTSILPVLKNKQLLILCGFCFFQMVTLAFYFGFYSIYFKERLGGSSSMLGWAYFLSSFSQLPFLLTSDKMYRKYGAGKLLIVSSALLGIRWMIVYLTDSLIVVFLTQVLHSYTFLMMSYVMLQYINEVVPPAYKASMQSTFTLGILGLARMVGSFGGGQIAQAAGERLLFLIGSIIALASALVFGVIIMKNKAAYAPGAGQAKIEGN